MATSWSRLASERDSGRVTTVASISRRTCSPCPTSWSRRRSSFVLGTIHASPQRVGHHSLRSRAVSRSSRRACTTGTPIEYSCVAGFTAAFCMETDRFSLTDDAITSSERPNKDHWSECGRAMPVADSGALGCPHRSVPVLGRATMLSFKHEHHKLQE